MRIEKRVILGLLAFFLELYDRDHIQDLFKLISKINNVDYFKVKSFF